ncbi:hypothetical protein T10_251 [Trichinella papuae]|uniref:Uncharacterized protein n=1 Tax=Trichinella papuae TaxID=268474 RepID=A0A0V1M3L1_9BILA|nr:hypothetical protein T10_6691 [Trichinella papuae]KRZ66296.1 hypothetical protein T10_13015 [Trichinella papuae]KRZ66953.1 hypothetical protein T10_10775 [Trichinella papuae]KRZ75190.1 hypothetical protein T10_251 [Trichinella papuae]
MSSFMLNRNLLPDSDVYLVSTSITNTGIDIYEKYSQYPVQNFSKQKISDSRPYLIFDSSVSCDESQIIKSTNVGGRLYYTQEQNTKQSWLSINVSLSQYPIHLISVLTPHMICRDIIIGRHKV